MHTLADIQSPHRHNKNNIGSGELNCNIKNHATFLLGQDMFTEERLYFCLGRVAIHRGSILLILLPNMIKEFRRREAGLSVLQIAGGFDRIF